VAREWGEGKSASQIGAVAKERDVGAYRVAGEKTNNLRGDRDASTIALTECGARELGSVANHVDGLCSQAKFTVIF